METPPDEKRFITAYNAGFENGEAKGFDKGFKAGLEEGVLQHQQHMKEGLKALWNSYVLTSIALETVISRIDELVQVERGMRNEVLKARAGALGSLLATVSRDWKTAALNARQSDEGINKVIICVSAVQDGIDSVLRGEDRGDYLRSLTTEHWSNLNLKASLDEVNWNHKEDDLLALIDQKIAEFYVQGMGYPRAANAARAYFLKIGNKTAADRIPDDHTIKGWAKQAFKRRKAKEAAELENTGGSKAFNPLPSGDE